MSGQLVILSGPSGVGKDTVIERWRDRNLRVERVVAYTTRQPREGEWPGLDYNFVSSEQFHEMIDAGHFLEHKEVYGNHYGTPLKDMQALLDQGKIAILKIDVQGALSAMELRPEAISIFLLPPDLDELERRIHSRALDSPEMIQKRQQKAMEEIGLSGRYHHRLVNDDLDRLVDELERIVSR